MKPQVITLRTDRDAQRLHALLKLNWRAMAAQGEPLDVIVHTHKAKRNTEQNKYYWRLLGFIAENAWVGGKQYPPLAYHEDYKIRFIGCVDLPSGRVVGISTTTLGEKEFSDYIEKVMADAAEQYAVDFSFF